MFLSDIALVVLGRKKKTCIKMEKEVSELFWLTDGMNAQAENPKQWAGSGRDIN